MLNIFAIIRGYMKGINIIIVEIFFINFFYKTAEIHRN